MKLAKNLVTALVILIVLAGVILLKTFVFQTAHPGHSSAGKRLKGPANALVKIVEYTDFQCPACGKAFVVVEELLKKYDGKVSLEHKHYPLKMHAHSMKASIFAECADQQGKFWPMHDVLFKSQSSWDKMPDPSQYFTDLAVGLGMDGVLLNACVFKGEAEKRIKADQEDGRNLGIQSTPTFVIDGKLYVGLKNLQTELERRLGQ
jgi:protein-disulfide isomerase